VLQAPCTLKPAAPVTKLDGGSQARALWKASYRQGTVKLARARLRAAGRLATGRA